MKLPASERRAVAFRVLDSVPEQPPPRAPVAEPEPLPEPKIQATPQEILALAAAVYDGLSEDEIRELEAVALDRSNFLRRTA